MGSSVLWSFLLPIVSIIEYCWTFTSDVPTWLRYERKPSDGLVVIANMLKEYGKRVIIEGNFGLPDQETGVTGGGAGNSAGAAAGASASAVVETNDQISTPRSAPKHYEKLRCCEAFCRLFGFETLEAPRSTAATKKGGGKPGSKSAQAAAKAARDEADAPAANGIIEEAMRSFLTAIGRDREWALAIREEAEHAKLLQKPNAIAPTSIVELNILRLIAHMNAVVKAVSDNSASVNRETILDIWIGVRKIIGNIRTITTLNIEVMANQPGRYGPASDRAIRDLEQAYTNFVQRVGIKIKRSKRTGEIKETTIIPGYTLQDQDANIAAISDEFPGLLQRNSFDNWLPRSTIKPYPAQEEIIREVVASVCRPGASRGLVMINNDRMGGGKTTALIGLAAAIKASRHAVPLDETQQTLGRRIEICYVHTKNNRLVGEQVGGMLTHTEIPWGFYNLEGQEPNVYPRMKISDTGKQRVRGVSHKNIPYVLLTSPVCCSSLLAINQKRKDDVKELRERGASAAEIEEKERLIKKYIVFWDEPTSLGIDRTWDMSQPHTLSQLPKDAPMSMKILGEIALNSPDVLALVSATIDNAETFPELIQQYRTHYPQARVRTINGSVSKIGSLISDMDGNIYMAHQNTSTVEQLIQVIARLREYPLLLKCYTAKSVRAMFDWIQGRMAINPDHVFGTYLSQPGNLSQQSIEDLALIYLETVLEHSSTLATTDVDAANQFVQEFCAASGTPRVNFSFSDFVRHRTSGAIRGQTLLVSADPERTAYENLCYSGEASASARPLSLLEQLERAGGSFDTAMARHTAALAEIDRKIIEFKDKAMVQIEKEQEIAKLENSRPTFSPYEAFANRNGLVSITSVNWRDIHTSDQLKALLSVGIAVYSPSTMHSSYTDVVVKLMDQGALALIISDDTICYGVNYPIENIVAMGDALVPRSVQTVLQLFARAGRPGKSDRANIWIDGAVIAKLHDFVHNPGFHNVERENIRHAFVLADRAVQDEAARIEAERVAAEQAEAARIEAERVAAEQAEAARIEAERVAAERIAAEVAELAELERLEAERAAAALVFAAQIPVVPAPPAGYTWRTIGQRVLTIWHRNNRWAANRKRYVYTLNRMSLSSTEDPESVTGPGATSPFKTEPVLAHRQAIVRRLKPVVDAYIRFSENPDVSEQQMEVASYLLYLATILLGSDYDETTTPPVRPVLAPEELAIIAYYVDRVVQGAGATLFDSYLSSLSVIRA